MAFPFVHLPALDWTSLGSFLASLFLFRALIYQYLPPELISYLRKLADCLFNAHHRSITIQEIDSNGTRSEAYDAALRYLSDKSSHSAKALMLTKNSKSKTLSFTLSTNQTLHDEFRGVKLKWTLYSTEPRTEHGEVRSLELSFNPKFSELVRDLYLPHVMETAEEMERKQRGKNLHSNRHFGNGRSSWWTSVNFDHPSTFETLAIEPEIKSLIMNDLTQFLKKEKYCKRVGRTWKRGYLLYGPPGTGKTSLIAAIANFLQFHIYDLELTAVSDNFELRTILLGTNRRSVIVIEDIDCSLQLSERNGKESDEAKKGSEVTLSGVLNFMDGLWSCCGEEKLMIFTTNHKERLDPALLRAGRMDLHIHLSYCGVAAFRQLVKNYLDVEDHPMMREIEEVLLKVETTPADITEVLMGNGGPDLVLGNVLSFLHERARNVSMRCLSSGTGQEGL